jgi:hypothetical protein
MDPKRQLLDAPPKLLFRIGSFGRVAFLSLFSPHSCPILCEDSGLFRDLSSYQSAFASSPSAVVAWAGIRRKAVAKSRKPEGPVAAPGPDNSGLVCGIAELLGHARHEAAGAVNGILTATYWEIGRRIVEFEQGGQAQAEYGEALLQRLAQDLGRSWGEAFYAKTFNSCGPFTWDGQYARHRLANSRHAPAPLARPACVCRPIRFPWRKRFPSAGHTMCGFCPSLTRKHAASTRPGAARAEFTNGALEWRNVRWPLVEMGRLPAAILWGKLLQPFLRKRTIIS